MNISAVFKAMNDATRREILELLKKKDMTAGEIAERFSISWPSISHHLELLKQADLVTSSKKGQFVEYALNTTMVDEVLKWLMQLKAKRK